MDLKEGLENLKKNQVDLEPDMMEALNSTTEKVGKSEPSKDKPDAPLSFEGFKRRIGKLILDDKILIQMRLKWYEDATTMIVFQGVRSNVIARLRSNGQHVINRSVFKKRVQEVLELEMEPSEEQRLGKERSKPLEKPQSK